MVLSSYRSQSLLTVPYEEDFIFWQYLRNVENEMRYNLPILDCIARLSASHKMVILHNQFPKYTVLHIDITYTISQDALDLTLAQQNRLPVNKN